MKNKHFINILKIFISLSLLAYFFHKSDLNTILFYLKNFPLWIFLTATLLTIVSIYINSLKWQLLLKNQKVAILYKLNLISQYYTLILPGQIAGEAVKTFILGRNNKDIEGIAVSVIVDKITGFLGLFILMVIGLLLTKISYSPIILWSVLAAFCAGVFFLFCLQINMLFNIVNHFINRIKMKFPKLKRVIQSFQKAFIAWHQYSKQIMTILLSITAGILYQFMGVFLFYFIGNNLNISMPLIDWFWIVGLLSIALFLPITIGGIGVREGTLVGILGTMGVVPEKALALSFIVFGVQIITSLIGGIFAWTNPLPGN